MAYSSVAQARANDTKMVSGTIGDVAVGDRIDTADEIVETDLSTVIDFTLVTDTPAGCPSYINQLSQYKTMELSLVSLYGAKREAETQTDRQYWAGLYKILLEKILNGEIDISAVSKNKGVFENNVREDVIPALGMGDDAGFIDEDDIEAQRDEYGDS